MCVFGLPSVGSSQRSHREKRRGVGKGEQGEGKLGLHLLSEAGVLLRIWEQAAGAIGLPTLHSPFVVVWALTSILEGLSKRGLIR